MEVTLWFHVKGHTCARSKLELLGTGREGSGRQKQGLGEKPENHR